MLGGEEYYKLILGMWQMLSFKNLCLGEMELLGQMTMARQWVRNQFGRKQRGAWKMGLTRSYWRKETVIAFHLIPGKRKSMWVSCLTVIHTRCFRNPAYKSGFIRSSTILLQPYDQGGREEPFVILTLQTRKLRLLEIKKPVPSWQNEGSLHPVSPLIGICFKM